MMSLPDGVESLLREEQTAHAWSWRVSWGRVAPVVRAVSTGVKNDSPVKH